MNNNNNNLSDSSVFGRRQQTKIKLIAVVDFEPNWNVSGQRPISSRDRLRGASPAGRPQRGQEEEGREAEDPGGADQHHTSREGKSGFGHPGLFRFASVKIICSREKTR